MSQTFYKKKSFIILHKQKLNYYYILYINIYYYYYDYYNLIIVNTYILSRDLICCVWEHFRCWILQILSILYNEK